MRVFGFLKKNKPKKRPAIIDVNDSDFKEQVVNRSYKMPVIVDYWAAWCGPCRYLGPILEKIAEEPSSDFMLAKLDTERNQKTASRYQIRSIPAVKAFRNGQIVDEFTGALPETLVRRFIRNVSEAEPPPAVIKSSPDPVQRLKQARQHLLKGRGFEAFVVLNDFPEGDLKKEADQLLRLARFIFDMDDGDGLTGLEELDKEYLAAANAMHRSKFGEALEHLKEALTFGEDFDRSHTVAVIDSLLVLLGEDSKLARELHDQLQ